VQAQVANGFEEIGLLLDDDRLIPVLEEVAGPLVPAVEGAGVAVRRLRMARKMRCRSRPRTLTWCRIPGASRRGWRGITAGK